MIKYLSAIFLIILLLLACRKQPYQFYIDSRFDSVIHEANVILHANGVKISLKPSTTKGDVEFHAGLCDGHTGMEHKCDIKICNTAKRTSKEMARTLLHEIGHCAGLTHVDDRTNIMFIQNWDTATNFNDLQRKKINEGH